MPRVEWVFVLLYLLLSVGNGKLSSYSPDTSCFVYIASDGLTRYNLKSLSREEDYVGYDLASRYEAFEGPVSSNFEYIFNFCKPVNVGPWYNVECQKQAPVLQTKLNVRESRERDMSNMTPANGGCVPTGLFPAFVTDHPAGVRSGITIKYVNDVDLCKHHTPRISEFILSCSKKEFFITKIEETSRCHYIFQIETAHACPVTRNDDFDLNKWSSSSLSSSNVRVGVPVDSSPSFFTFNPPVPTIQVTAISENTMLMLDESGFYVGSQGQKLDTFSITTSNERLGVQYKAQTKYIGYTEWKRNGELVGTSAHPITAFAIRLTGPLASQYDIKYAARFEGGETEQSQNGYLVRCQGECLGMSVWLDPHGVKDEL